MMKNQNNKEYRNENNYEATVSNGNNNRETGSCPVEIKGSLPKVLIPFLPLQQFTMEGRSIWKTEQ
ncbi:hypothetical protein MNV_110022 [Candidatus Methanoperedens nitroreducens]|uniref:Uncharacterized protein n=1 Tax=Candidatus Methanoperedens nitratireducens TaxID=1392998 RepID=A0A284VIV8_9EURY|nr:hypothetical protein MNV_110022 [Candidatus Methanoperedens nitroreducens]